MVRNTKKKYTKRNTYKKRKQIVKAKPSTKPESFKNFRIFVGMVVKSPFIFINMLIKGFSILSFSLLQRLYLLVKKIVSLFSNIKEAIFVLIFGFLAGCIGAVVVFSYLDFNSQNRRISENMLNENVNLSESISSINGNIESIFSEQENIKENLTSLMQLNEQLTDLKNLSDLNNQSIFQASEEIKAVALETENLGKSLKKLSIELEQNSKLMLSSSKSELSNRLYLAQSLLGRLKSGVPYAPELIALGKEGLDPALLRFAKGGAPTLSDLAARLSVRAGELKDADKTKRDSNWRDNFKKEFNKLVKIKPTDINKITGTPGVLLRAEYAISNGNLDKAIDEIDSLAPQDRGALNAWLTEAIATKNANIAAENLLAKTTAALKKRN